MWRRYPVRTVLLGMVWLLAAAALLRGQSAIPRSVPDSRADREQLRRATVRYESALRATDADLLAAAFASDGELVNDGQVLARGPDAIRLFLLAGRLAVQIESFRMPIETIKVVGGQGTVRGRFQQSAFMLMNQETVATHGTYAILWLRAKNGGWLIRRLETRSAGP